MDGIVTVAERLAAVLSDRGVVVVSPDTPGARAMRSMPSVTVPWLAAGTPCASVDKVAYGLAHAISALGGPIKFFPRHRPDGVTADALREQRCGDVIVTRIRSYDIETDDSLEHWLAGVERVGV